VLVDRLPYNYCCRSIQPVATGTPEQRNEAASSLPEPESSTRGGRNVTRLIFERVMVQTGCMSAPTRFHLCHQSSTREPALGQRVHAVHSLTFCMYTLGHGRNHFAQKSQSVFVLHQVSRAIVCSFSQLTSLAMRRLDRVAIA
jgi:hypothetical protein